MYSGKTCNIANKLKIKTMFTFQNTLYNNISITKSTTNKSTLFDVVYAILRGWVVQENLDPRIKHPNNVNLGETAKPKLADYSRDCDHPFHIDNISELHSERPEICNPLLFDDSQTSFKSTHWRPSHKLPDVISTRNSYRSKRKIHLQTAKNLFFLTL